MNVRKLRKLQKWILAEPLRFDMKEWRNKQLASDRGTPCGTVGCLAGMACHMEGTDINSDAVFYDAMGLEGRAKEILGLDSDRAERLFYMRKMHHLYTEKENCWPTKFEAAYTKAKTPRGKARVAARRIDLFIKTKGAE